MALPDDSADALVQQGRLHSTNKDFQAALRCYKAANALAPYRADIWAELGKTYLDLGDSETGYDAANYAVQLDPALAQGYYVRAWARGNQGDFEGEIEDAREGYRLNPNSPEIYYRRLGRAHAGLGDVQYALTCCHLVIAFDPNDAPALINRAGLYRVLKRYNDAFADFERVIALAPHWYVPHYALGLTLIDAQRYTEAIHAFSRALETDPDSNWYPRILAFRAYAYELDGRHAEAERDTRRARELNPNVQLYGAHFPRSP